MSEHVTLIATATMGLEALVAREVKALGYSDVQVENGRIEFQAPLQAIARTNMWLRTADRVKLKAAEFTAESFDELFEKTKAVPWETLLPANAEFPVVGRSVKSTLYSVPDCQSIVKKAVVERLKQTYQKEWFPENGGLYKIEAALHKDTVTLTIDTSGAGLHKRGYRSVQNTAPLKETLAASLVMLTNWHPDRPFADPFCGSGTIPIEAALIGQQIAPGFNREFAAESWQWLGTDMWKEAREEAEDKAEYDQPLDIQGSDIDHRIVELAQENAMEAGLYGVVNFKQMQASDFTARRSYGCLVSNPPYGERLSGKEETEILYRDIGEAFRPLDTWSVYILTSNEAFETFYGNSATKKRKLYNGKIKTDYYQFWGQKPPKM
ncbi:THUMP domain-containing class I SAM-dependent RNA methyltransferase [Salibacterium halotolerans]|uniref:Putative N6-adenine-specific DNA methylase n=1 Tax=Salibacterium halotolerans TaxID=1884432 RepID=A0A1I5URV8_9BACI|nr:class I SAM-dependent RNA methyltransferase [Salibacterium halotolerans]SFP97932.1 putative N6-adenine-specific DNA methylase [Salibacterium halotolerans]